MKDENLLQQWPASAMHRKKIIVRPAGGLCNRLQVFASAIVMANELDRYLYLVWDNYPAAFNELFEIPVAPEMTVEEYNRIKEDNSGNVKVIERKTFHRIKEISPATKEDTILIFGNHSFYNSVQDFFNVLRSFKPRQKIVDRMISIPQNTVGVHIRRTDNKLAIAESTNEKFMAIMDELVAEFNDIDITFFLTTDDPETKELFVSRYDRILTYDVEYSRRDAQGVKDALLELMTLAQTRVILGSTNSSFSTMAALFNLSTIMYITDIHNIKILYQTGCELNPEKLVNFS